MHIVFLNQYYPPDAAPTGLMLESVATHLAAAGHDVTILCARGGYAQQDQTHPPTSADTHGDHPPRVIRVGATTFGRRTFLGKLADYATFYLGVAWHLTTLHPRPDRVVALTTPPCLAILARFLSRLRGADHAHWIMDLYPDVMISHGMLKAGSLPHRLLRLVSRLGLGGTRCRAIVTLGPDMAARVDTCLNARKSEWVPLWATDAGHAADPSVSAAHPHAAGDLVLMYSGNMGLGHRFGEFLKLAASKPAGIRFVFAGDGKRRPEIEEFRACHPDAPVELRGYAPRHLLAAHLASADVHLASLEPAWDGTMVPSKLQGIFAAARPVIFIGSDTSSIARWIRESGGGWVVPPDDLDALKAAVDSARDPAERARRGQAAAAYAVSHFDREQNTRRVASLLVDS